MLLLLPVSCKGLLRREVRGAAADETSSLWRQRERELRRFMIGFPLPFAFLPAKHRDRGLFSANRQRSSSGLQSGCTLANRQWPSSRGLHKKFLHLVVIKYFPKITLRYDACCLSASRMAETETHPRAFHALNSPMHGGGGANEGEKPD